MRMEQPDRRQRLLLPPSIDEFVGPKHRVRVIVEVIDRLDLSHIEVGSEETGRPAFPPSPMVSLLFYALSLGIFSAREMARRCQTDCAFMFATAGLRPSYRTIARFRAHHEEALSDLFTQVVVICRRMGLGDTQVVAIDGTRQRANASLDAHVRREQLEKELKRIRKDMKKMLAQAAQVDTEEDAQQAAPGEDEAVPEKLAKQSARAYAIAEAIEALNEMGAREANATDPDARLQKFKKESHPGYNAQVAVSGEDGLIVASDVVQEAGDTEQMLPLLDQVEHNAKESPGVVVADAGYEKGESFKKLKEKGQDAIVSSACEKAAHKKKRESGRFQWTDFKYDEKRDEYICPTGKRLVRVSHRKLKGKVRVHYEGIACGGCKLKPACTRAEVRRLQVLETTRYLLAMFERRRQDRKKERWSA